MTCPRMDVTFVIPVFNQLDYTAPCLDSLNRAGVPDNAVVVVDNGSSDGTAAFLAGRPGLRVLRNPANVGCSAAWNQGVQASKTAWTMILNNDVLVAQGLCEGLVSFAEQARCYIVSPGLGEGEMDYDLEAFAKAFTVTMRPACRRGVAMGCAFMVHRRVFDAIGQFDPQIGLAGMEDEDFYRRAQQAGFRLGMTGRAFLHHFGSVTQISVKAGLGLPQSARLADATYFRKKHRLNWFKRQADRRREKFLNAFWNWNERRRFGMTLRMRRHAGQWQPY
jgi:N-acetylglucosaminyl-diphospho-decaprenol L-rhamnosyltransferase